MNTNASLALSAPDHEASENRSLAQGAEVGYSPCSVVATHVAVHANCALGERGVEGGGGCHVDWPMARGLKEDAVLKEVLKEEGC